MTGAVATFNAVGQRNTVFLDPNGVSDLRRSLFLWLDEFDGTRRANLRTVVALGTAIALLVTHRRHHQRHQVGRGSQHLIRTFRHAELAARAVLREMLRRQCPRRCNRCLAMGRNLVFDGRKTTIDFLRLLSQCSRRNHRRSQQERAFGSVGLLFSSLLYSFTPQLLHSILQRPKLTLTDAISTNHAARIIHRVGLVVDAGSLAILRTKRAITAFSASNRIFINEKRLKKLNTVPTGQIVLQ